MSNWSDHGLSRIWKIVSIGQSGFNSVLNWNHESELKPQINLNWSSASLDCFWIETTDQSRLPKLCDVFYPTIHFIGWRHNVIVIATYIEEMATFELKPGDRFDFNWNQAILLISIETRRSVWFQLKPNQATSMEESCEINWWEN